MAEETIERLQVVIESNIEDLVDGADKGIKRVEGRLKKMGDEGEDAFDRTKKAGTGLTQVFGKLQTVASAFIALFAAQRVFDFFKRIGSAAVQANAQFETFRTQFETLLGSAQAARSRLDELARFGVETPFELPEVVEASRVLQVFGGTALATGDNLRMIGNIAAGVNQPFKDVAFWIGRMFDALKSGRPFGEASLRLQEMGALSGDVRAQMEAMQKAGASGAEIFAFFSEQVGGKFAGNMERLSKTFQGVTSNLIDFRDNLLRIGGEPLFDEVSESANRFLDIISEDEMSAALTNLARAAGEAAANLSDLASTGFFDALEDIEPETVDKLAESLRDAAAALTEFLDSPITANMNGLIEAVIIVTDSFTAFTNVLNRAKSLVELVNPLYEALKDVFFAIFFPLRNVIKQLGRLNDLVEQISGKEIVDFSRDIAEASETTEQSSKRFFDAIRNISAAGAGLNVGEEELKTAALVGDPEQIEEDNEKIKEILLDNFSTLLDLRESLDEKTEELNRDHQEKMVEIERNFAEKRLDAAEDLEKDLADLEDETARKRAEIFKDAREDLADLEADTDRQLKDERERFNTEERRDTEDHLKDMRRLREQFLFDLEDAVKSRDARAVVDLRRRFEMEQREQTEDFETKQGREREDQDQRLAEIRENEARRSAEIIAARERELAQLAENEARKRAELQAGFQQEIADLNEAETEKLATEQTRFEERQAELDAALTERLTLIAQKLAEEKDINEEGAAAILGTLANYFGAGGEIDNLMAAFRERMKARLDIQVDFESEGKRTTSDSRPRGGFRGSSVRAFAQGGSMIARPPGQLALFGERVPELGQFTPLDQMQKSMAGVQNKEITLRVEMSGSAPPGIHSNERDQIAGVFVQALREAGLKG